MFQSIQKFGLSYCDFPTMLSNVTFFLRTLSLNVDPRNQTRTPMLYTVLDIIFTASYCYVYLVSMFWFIFWRCMETEDVLLALIIFSLGTSSQIGLQKIVFMFYHRLKLTELARQCLDSYELVAPGSRFMSNLTNTLRTVKKRAIVFWSVIVGNGCLYILKPLILPGKHLMEDDFIFLGLEPMFETPNYQIAFTLTAMGDLVTVYFPSNATAFQIVISGYIEAQMLAWSDELSNLWDDATKYYTECKTIERNDTNSNLGHCIKQKDIIINDYISHRLKYIIKAHATNLSMFKGLEEAFQGVIAVEFGLLVIGLIAELLAGLKNTYMEVPFGLMQVGMDCFIGQKVADASLLFERAVYECKWERFNQVNMKEIVTMLMVSQRTLTLSAGGITTLNFVSLLAIFKMIYSTYTTFSAMIT